MLPSVRLYPRDVRKKMYYSNIGQHRSSVEPELLTHLSCLKTLADNSIKVWFFVNLRSTLVAALSFVSD